MELQVARKRGGRTLGSASECRRGEKNPYCLFLLLFLMLLFFCDRHKKSVKLRYHMFWQLDIKCSGLKILLENTLWIYFQTWPRCTDASTLGVACMFASWLGCSLRISLCILQEQYHSALHDGSYNQRSTVNGGIQCWGCLKTEPFTM